MPTVEAFGIRVKMPTPLRKRERERPTVSRSAFERAVKAWADLPARRRLEEVLKLIQEIKAPDEIRLRWSAFAPPLDWRGAERVELLTDREINTVRGELARLLERGFHGGVPVQPPPAVRIEPERPGKDWPRGPIAVRLGHPTMTHNRVLLATWALVDLLYREGSRRDGSGLFRCPAPRARGKDGERCGRVFLGRRGPKAEQIFCSGTCRARLKMREIRAKRR
jgi:hypothetical protein